MELIRREPFVWAVLGFYCILGTFLGAWLWWARQNIPALCDRVAYSRSSEEDKQVFLQIVSYPWRDEKVRELFRGWGKKGIWYDQGIMRFMFRTCEDLECDQTLIIDRVLSRLDQEPDLLRQIAWWFNWYVGPGRVARWVYERPENFGLNYDKQEARGRLTIDTSEPYLRALAESLDSFGSRGEFYRLLYVASLMNDPGLLDGVRPENVDSKWQATKAWLRDNGQFLRFDPRLNHYVVDHDALTSGSPVPSSDQIPGFPPTPLPEWPPQIPARLYPGTVALDASSAGN